MKEKREESPYLNQRVLRDTLRLLRIVASINTESVVDLIDRLVREEIARKKYHIPGG